VNHNYKLYFKYLYLNINHLFFKYKKNNNTNLNIYIYQNHFYYSIIHLKLSSIFYTTQLSDIFAYEVSLNNNINNKPFFNNILVYNFHNIKNQNRFFFFIIKNKNNFSKLNSIAELFLNANWLEREVAELHNIFFYNKKDLRNLMLPYGDSSNPMLKTVPSIGLHELFYDSVSDLIIQTPVTIQF